MTSLTYRCYNTKNHKGRREYKRMSKNTMKVLSMFLNFFGIIVLIVGLTTNDAIGWIATGSAMLLIGIILAVARRFVNE